MEDNGDRFQSAGGNGVRVAEDFDGMIAREAAGEDDGEVKVKEGPDRSGP